MKYQAVQVVVYFANLGLWIGFIILRFKHGGRVCSGDYLPSHKDTEGYLNNYGECMKVVIISMTLRLVL